jgi:hypothetical protein
VTASEPVIQLPAADVGELIELLQFLDDWLATCPGQLREPFTRFAGHPAYGITQLRDDLQRLAFLLGADNEEQLFGQQTQDVIDTVHDGQPHAGRPCHESE